jgi:predicted transcriptional regulator
MVYTDAMATTKRKPVKHVRRSVTITSEIARQVDSIAKDRRLSENRVLLELIEQGIEARKEKQKAFVELAERFRAENDPEQVKQLGDQLGRFVFGE